MDDVASSIAGCESLPDLWKVMLRYFTGQGFGGVFYSVYGLMEPVAGVAAETPPTLLHGFTAEQKNAYLNADYQRLDVVPRLALAQGRPLRWREAWAMADITEAEQGFLHMMQGVQLGEGFCLPCYGPAGRNAYVGIGRMTETAHTDAVSVGTMHVMAQAAHLKICTLTMDTVPGRALSARETEILNWVARGKSNSVIADILAISASTVDTYLRRIYEKLGVSDRTSAAVRGIGMGLISM